MEEEGDFYSARKFYIKVYDADKEYKDVRFILDRFDSKIKEYINVTRKKARELYNDKKYNIVAFMTNIYKYVDITKN